MASQDDLKAQLRQLMTLPENMRCVDCGDKRPTWASLIVPPESVAFSEPLGCFCCYHCSGAHRRMGTHICFVRSTNLDEWKEKELHAMRKGGNALINKLFEGKLTSKQKAVIKPDEHTELDPRSNFIYDKYQHRKWFDLKAAKDVSNFQVQNGKRVSNGAFDDFFALRTKDAASDAWHGDGEADTPAPLVRKQNAYAEPSRSMMSSFSGKTSPCESELPGVQAVRPKSLRRGQPDPRVDILNRTLQRMDSKRELLQTIRGFEKDDGDKNISPRKIKQSSRRLKDSNVVSESRPGGNSTTSRPRTRRGAHGEDESRGGEANRSKSASSHNSDTQDSRSGSSRKSSKPEVTRSSARNTAPDARSVGKTASRSPGPGACNKQSHVPARQKSPGALSRSRGVARTQSMGYHKDGEQGSNRRRSRSTKRTVRRTHSSEMGAIFADGDASTVGFDGNASQVSTRSARRTTRILRRDSDDAEDEEVSRSSNHRSRREDSSRTRTIKKDVRAAPNSRSRSRPRKPVKSSSTTQ